MTPDEIASSPEARLGGALLWMVVAAALLCVLILLGTALAPAQLREIGIRYIAAIAFVFVWSILFVAMTLLAARATPLVASIGIVAWVAYRFGVAALQGHWPLVADLVGEAALAAAFCGYMAEGVRPNAYYRHRLPMH